MEANLRLLEWENLAAGVTAGDRHLFIKFCALSVCAVVLACSLMCVASHFAAFAIIPVTGGEKDGPTSLTLQEFLESEALKCNPNMKVGEEGGRGRKFIATLHYTILHQINYYLVIEPFLLLMSCKCLGTDEIRTRFLNTTLSSLTDDVATSLSFVFISGEDLSLFDVCAVFVSHCHDLHGK